jgi:hypothetical protein
MTEDLSAGPDLDVPEEPEIEWRRVTDWPSQSVMLRKDIAAIIEVLALMEGAADDASCHVFTDFLRAVLLERRRELAVMILEFHEIAIPEPGSVQTPQEQMSDQLRKARDAVRHRREDIVPPEQPFTDRYGPGRPGLQMMEQGGLPGLHRPLPRLPDMTPKTD